MNKKEPKRYRLSEEIINKKEPNKIPMPSLKNYELDDEKKENIYSYTPDEYSSEEFKLCQIFRRRKTN